MHFIRIVINKNCEDGVACYGIIFISNETIGKFIEKFERGKNTHTYSHRHTTHLVTTYAYLFLNFLEGRADLNNVTGSRLSVKILHVSSELHSANGVWETYNCLRIQFLWDMKLRHWVIVHQCSKTA
jgi:hypothetical protein